jgi:hypothetical protein
MVVSSVELQCTLIGGPAKQYFTLLGSTIDACQRDFQEKCCQQELSRHVESWGPAPFWADLRKKIYAPRAVRLMRTCHARSLFADSKNSQRISSDLDIGVAVELRHNLSNSCSSILTRT